MKEMALDLSQDPVVWGLFPKELVISNDSQTNPKPDDEESEVWLHPVATLFPRERVNIKWDYNHVKK